MAAKELIFSFMPKPMPQTIRERYTLMATLTAAVPLLVSRPAEAHLSYSEVGGPWVSEGSEAMGVVECNLPAIVVREAFN